MPDPKPQLFISHKHAPTDMAIARAIADFAEAKSGARVKVHLSSSREFEGPRYGKSLNAELRAALWKTDVLVLIYTSADQDWQFCMWECGVATDSQSPDTNIIVFQCGNDVPTPLQDLVRVNVRDRDAVKGFARQFLKQPGFFPSLDGALSPDLRDQLVEEAGDDLVAELEKVVPPIDEGLVAEWAAWPYLRVELPKARVREVEQAPDPERAALTQQIVREHAVVADSDARAAQLFGQAGFLPQMKFELLLRIWQDRYPDADATWFDSCCEQIMTGAGRGFPVIRWTPLREVGGDREFTPVLSRVRRAPLGQSVYFDLYFYNLADPRAIPVTSKMIPVDKLFYKNLGQIDLATFTLRQLVGEMEARGLGRVPLFSAERHPMYIIHGSMIDKFIRRQMWEAQAQPPRELTLADLLDDPELRRMFEETFVVVKKSATLAEARGAMAARPGCSDVFVTDGGTHNEPVIGWLTNVDMVRVE